MFSGCEIFADGFAGAVKSPDGARYRPSGLAYGPDGTLYISDDVKGRIYRVVYRGDPAVMFMVRKTWKRRDVRQAGREVRIANRSLRAEER